MKTVVLNIDEIRSDCSREEHEFGEALELLTPLANVQIDMVFNEEEYLKLLENSYGLNEDGCVDDIGGIDWDKYDYVTIAETKDGCPVDFYSFRENWLTKVA